MARGNSAPEILTLDEIANHQIDVNLALTTLFRDSPTEFIARYAEFSLEELGILMATRLRMTDMQCSLTVLAAVEAAFRIDYEIRCKQKLKDDLSRKFRELFKKFDIRVRLEEDILQTWKDEYQATAVLIGELKGAFKYRHWLAHGQYWFPKMGREYDFQTVFTIADQTLASLYLLSES